jgi:hypothetical protein
MWGEKSSSANPRTAERVRRTLQRAHSVRIDIIHGAGNMAVQEDPEGTARSAKEFLDAGHGDAPNESKPRRDPRYDRDDGLPLDSLYVTRNA